MSAAVTSPRRSHTTLCTEVQWDDVGLHWLRGTCIRSRPHHPVDWQPVQFARRVSLSSVTWTPAATPTPSERNICHHNSSVSRTLYHRPTTLQCVPSIQKSWHWARFLLVTGLARAVSSRSFLPTGQKMSRSFSCPELSGQAKFLTG